MMNEKVMKRDNKLHSQLHNNVDCLFLHSFSYPNFVTKNII